MCNPTRIDTENESTLPPLEVPVWLIEKNNIFIGCRTDFYETGEEDRTWLWARCESYWYDSSKHQWVVDDTDLEDYQPIAWMELPNLEDFTI